MGAYYLLEVSHASVAYFDSVSVKNFMKRVVLRECVIEDFKESSSDIGGYVFAEGRVVPGDVPFPFGFLCWSDGCRCEL